MKPNSLSDKMLINALVFGVSAIAISGCDPLEPIETRTSTANALLDEIEQLDPTPTADMPTSGFATYIGYATGEIEVSDSMTDTVVSDATLVASFSGVGGTLSGTMDNFDSDQSADMEGSVLILNGGIITGNTFAGNVGGILVYDTDTDTDTITVNAVTSGEFLGPTGDAVLGDIVGTADRSSGYSGNLDMVIFGEKQP